MRARPVCLSIAGTDPGGGAGVAADLATFAAHGVGGAFVVTAVTAQDASGVHLVEALDPAVVAAQLDAVLGDFDVSAVKVGMLATGAIVEVVARALAGCTVVVDPVLTATAGGALLGDDAVAVLLNRLVPATAVLTPNAEEAHRLTGVAVDSRAAAEEAGRVLVRRGAGAVLVKGGHLDLGDGLASDCLVVGGKDPCWFDGPRLVGVATHGTGCVLSSALAARLARREPLADAVAGAKAFVARAMVAGARSLDPWAAGPC